MSTTPAALRELALETAEAAGQLLARYAEELADGDDLGVTTKSSATDPVSAADHAAERLIVERLRAARPDDGMHGEEGLGQRRGSSGLTWVVDPLDGTVNFLYGLPMWCVSVAVVDEQGTLAGAVVNPPTGASFHAGRGEGAARGGRPLSVRIPERPDEALVATGFGYDREMRADWGRTVGGWLGHVRDVRRAGAAALDLAWVAAGQLDGFAEFGLNHWDYAAGVLLITESGGTVTYPRRALGTATYDGVVAGSAPVHEHLLRLLEEPA